MSKRIKSKGADKKRTLIFAASTAVLLVMALILILSSRTSTVVSQQIAPAEYQSQFVADNASHLLVDVRTPAEFDSGHIQGAINIPVESLASRLSEVPGDEPIVVYCRSGNRSAQASRILEDAGYNDIYDLGGVIDWTAAGFTLE